MEVKLFDWQKNAIQMAKTIPHMGLLAEQGTGKTLTFIRIAEDKMRFSVSQKIIIFSPLVTLQNWKNEIEKYSSNVLSSMPIHVHVSAKRKQTINFLYNTEGILLINYEALRNKDLAEDIVNWKASIVACDESHNIKNHKTQQAKWIKAISKHANHKYIMSGTPYLNDPKDIFGQFYFLNPTVFGSNFFVFRATYMEDKNAGWTNKFKYYPKWEAKEGALDKIADKIKDHSIRVLKKDCLDLPPLLEQTIHVPMSQEHQELYDDMKRDCIAFLKENEDDMKATVAQTAMTKMLRLQQIVSGYFHTDDGEDVTIGRNRLDTTMELVRTILSNPGSKVIIWCCFRYNVTELDQALNLGKISHVLLTGSQGVHEKQASIDAFQKNDNVRVLVANRRAGGIGVNLTAADYSIVYSRNFSLADELQADARNHRSGSEIHQKITKINLITPNTTDEVVYKAINSKQDASTRVLDYIKNQKGE
jgi:SNF2 family DNA or RNA helicase